MSSPPILVWSSIPTHHQSAFLAALREGGTDLRVHYFRRVRSDRLEMGWDPHEQLLPGESYVAEDLEALERCPDWRERVHIVPGYGCAFLLKLAWHLSRHGVPWLHWSEHSHPSLRSAVTFSVKRYYGGLVRRNALGALAIGELARREFVRWGIPPARIRYLFYAVAGFPELADTHRAELSAEATRFLFLGTLYPTKGIDLLLLAMREVLDHYPRARLTLIGNDLSGGKYEQEARRLGIAHALHFGRAVEALRVGAVIEQCDVLVLPSRHDGWGMVLNEAASVGRAMIATEACGAAHHVLQPGANGFRVPVGDAAELARAMMAYCCEPGLAALHGNESRRIFEDFTPGRNAQRFFEALNSLRSEANPALTHMEGDLRRARSGV